MLETHIGGKPRNRRQSPAMSKDRKEIYIGDGLKRALAGRKGSLTSNVNLIADRYAGIMREHRPYLHEDEVRMLRTVMAEFRRTIEANEIHGLAGMLTAALTRHFLNEADDLCLRLSNMTYVELVALVDYLESRS